MSYDCHAEGDKPTETHFNRQCCQFNTAVMCSRTKPASPLVVVITLSEVTPSRTSTQRSYGTNRKSNSRPFPV